MNKRWKIMEIEVFGMVFGICCLCVEVGLIVFGLVMMAIAAREDKED